MANTLHDKIANKLAAKFGAEYHTDKGVDIKTPTKAIEVESREEAFGEAKQQLAGTTRVPYIAVPTKLQYIARDYFDGSRIGVMNQNGRIIKRGRRRILLPS